jgi:secondary thiamine-phosphate synthase enzyme
MAFTVDTEQRTQVLDITARVRDALPSSAEGTCTVVSQHTTAAVVVNEAERRLLGDIERFVDELAPNAGWDHDDIDDNADAHLRALVLGPSVTLPVAGGDLDLGTWQSVLLVECDGPRTRCVEVVA